MQAHFRMYVLKAFQLYKEIIDPMGFDPWLLFEDLGIH
jgi:hypothetical protein